MRTEWTVGTDHSQHPARRTQMYRLRDLTTRLHEYDNGKTSAGRPACNEHVPRSIGELGAVLYTSTDGCRLTRWFHHCRRLGSVPSSGGKARALTRRNRRVAKELWGLRDRPTRDGRFPDLMQMRHMSPRTHNEATHTLHRGTVELATEATSSFKWTDSITAQHGHQPS
jgi:hypothetical protein